MPTYSVKGNDWLGPPPGAAVTTETVALPGAVCSEPGTLAVRLVLLPKVVGTLWPFHCTTEFVANPVPFTCTDSGIEPSGAEFGVSEVSCGAGGAVISTLMAPEGL